MSYPKKLRFHEFGKTSLRKKSVKLTKSEAQSEETVDFIELLERKLKLQKNGVGIGRLSGWRKQANIRNRY